MKKLLIISLSAGAGHVRIAEAVRQTALQKYPSWEVKHVDLADYISLPLKTTVVDYYAMLVKNIPSVFGFLYEKTNNSNLTTQFNKYTQKLKKLSFHLLV